MDHHKFYETKQIFEQIQKKGVYMGDRISKNGLIE